MSECFISLNKSLKIKLVRTLIQLYLSGIDMKDTIIMSNFQLRKSLGLKYSYHLLNRLKKNIVQLYSMKEENEGILNFGLSFFPMFGFSGKGLSRIKSDLERTIGLNNLSNFI